MREIPAWGPRALRRDPRTHPRQTTQGTDAVEYASLPMFMRVDEGERLEKAEEAS